MRPPVSSSAPLSIQRGATVGTSLRSWFGQSQATCCQAAHVVHHFLQPHAHCSRFLAWPDQVSEPRASAQKAMGQLCLAETCPAILCERAKKHERLRVTKTRAHKKLQLKKTEQTVPQHTHMCVELGTPLLEGSEASLSLLPALLPGCPVCPKSCLRVNGPIYWIGNNCRLSGFSSLCA